MFRRLPIVLLSIFLLFGITCIAKDFNAYSFLINDLRNELPSKTEIQAQLGYDISGIAITLEYVQEENRIVIMGNDRVLGFEEFSELVVQSMESDEHRLIPIFLDYRGPARQLISAIDTSALNPYVFYLPSGEKWPDANEILNSKKQILLFSFQRNNINGNKLMYVWDHVCEFPHSGLEDPYFDGFYPNGNIGRELMMVRDCDIPLIENRSNINYEINQNQSYLNHLLNRWKLSGKRPNFIFIQHNIQVYYQLIERLYSFDEVKGIVRNSGRPLEKVFWKHSVKCVTNGFFSFPYSEGEEMILTPFCPGFDFIPSSVVINLENLSDYPIYISANPLSINDGIKAFFSFEGSFKNIVKSSDQILPDRSTITTDIERGEVSKLSESASIQLGTPESYGIRNNSFTVSSWIKLNDVQGQSEYCILGSNEAMFRKGLHLMIRNERPYFGFYGNDLWSGRVIKKGVWTHIVFRYNILNGELAIFINGQERGASLNHSSFIGDSVLIIGQGIRGRNYLNGYVDDLAIWNRALGEEEIKKLYSEEIRPEIISKKDYINTRIFIFILVGLALVVTFLVVLVSRKRNAIIPNRSIEAVDEEQANSIFLFGDFKITGSKGEELSSMLSPKLKELLLVLLLYTVKNKKGISTSDLTAILWPDFEPSKAANNRSVSFNKLRKILVQIDGFDVKFDSGMWKAVYSSPAFCDYIKALNLLNSHGREGKQDYFTFFSLVKRGAFLDDREWPWLDEFRGYINNEVVDTLMSFTKILDRKEDSVLLHSICSRVLVVDDLNEKALQLEISLLMEKENENLARFNYDQFRKKYQHAYGERYPFSFGDFLAKKKEL